MCGRILVRGLFVGLRKVWRTVCISGYCIICIWNLKTFNTEAYDKFASVKLGLPLRQASSQTDILRNLNLAINCRNLI